MQNALQHEDYVLDEKALQREKGTIFLFSFVYTDFQFSQILPGAFWYSSFNISVCGLTLQWLS